MMKKLELLLEILENAKSFQMTRMSFVIEIEVQTTLNPLKC